MLNVWVYDEGLGLVVVVVLMMLLVWENDSCMLFVVWVMLEYFLFYEEKNDGFVVLVFGDGMIIGVWLDWLGLCLLCIIEIEEYLVVMFEVGQVNFVFYIVL